MNLHLLFWRCSVFSNPAAHGGTVRIVGVGAADLNPDRISCQESLREGGWQNVSACSIVVFPATSISSALRALAFLHLEPWATSSSPGSNSLYENCVFEAPRFFSGTQHNFRNDVLERKRNRLLYALSTSEPQLVVKEVGNL